MRSDAEQQQWEAFTDGVEGYLQQLSILCSGDLSQLDSHVTQQLETLLAQDARLMQCLTARLSTLSHDMAALRKSRSSSRAYNAV